MKKLALKACYTDLLDLKIGQATINDTLGLTCQPDHINTTATAHGTRSQYVYVLTDRWTAYLYFDNDRLVAKQI